jgi:hypothetical protein
MSVISTQQVIAGYKVGATWGTEVQVVVGSTGVNLYASQIQVSGGFADFLSRDFGQSGKRSNNARLQADFNVNITCDMTYGQGWLGLLAAFLGTESTPAEQTGSQADYLETIDFADSIDGKFITLAYTIETDRVIAFPSLKVVGVTIQQAINAAGTVSFRCIADRCIVSSTTSYANLSGLTTYNYETCTMGGTNHYARFDVYSTSVALTNADDRTILGYTLTLNRPFQPKRGLRGANTAYTLEPIQVGFVDCTLQLQHNELDNASFDIFGEYTTPAFKMAEIFLDGSVIGTTVNRSLKFQFPYMKIKGAIPPGHDVANNNSQFQPTATFDLLKAPAAPSGMSSVTDICRVTSIGPTRSTKWLA